MKIPKDYPEKLIQATNEYLQKHEGSEIFNFSSYTSNPYKDKSISQTTYRVYILYGNLFEVLRYRVCSKPEWNEKEVSSDSMLPIEIKTCYEKYIDMFGN